MTRARAVWTIVVLAALIPVVGYAAAPYTTWTIGPGGYFFPVQDAYTPLDEIDLPVDGPQDMFLAADDTLYVADTGGGRIIRLDSRFSVIGEYGAGLLTAPTGVYVDEEGTIYAADSSRNTVVILDAAGALIRELGRPTEPLFGANRQFLPRKIAVDPRDNLYVVSEGSVDGLVMLNTSGNFIGYFGANSADMSLRMILQRLILNEEQLDAFIRNEAASPSNLTLDAQALVYTVTAGTEPSRSIRKFTVSGRNLFTWVYGSESFRDIHVSADGLMTAIDGEGLIHEFDSNGVPLFFFGALDRGDQRLGLVSNPTAIERWGDRLLVLDRDKNAIVAYRVTDFARRLHEGVRLYMNGFYEAARPIFEELLTYNGLVLMAYQGIADADYTVGAYQQSLDYYRFAVDREGYSQAAWEMRNAVLQRWLGTGLGVLLGGWIVLGVVGRLDRRRGLFEPLRRALAAARRFRLADDFAFLFRFIGKPVDSYYYIKMTQRGSLGFALLLFGWIILSRVIAIYGTGFIFSPYDTLWEIRIENEILSLIVPIALFCAANYLVSTISDGEGSLRQVIIGTAYSLFPLALFTIPIALISNVLTLNEIFLYTFSNQLVIAWTGIMLVIMVKEIHNFTVSETVRNLIATLFTMAMFLLTGYILYILFGQLYEFVLAILQEVRLNA